VLQVLTTDQDQLIITDFFHTVAHYPSYSFSMLDKVKFKLLVLVQRICEFSLMTLDDMKTILL
jgi:hypothetical protein